MQRIQNWLTSGWAIGGVVILIVLGLASTARNVLQLEHDLVESMAIDDAARYSKALREFRTLYTSEVVERALSTGTKITHNYKDYPGALPLPATLSMLLGKRLTESPGGDVRLYSDFPFPWRSSEETSLDEFEQIALTKLRANPNEPVLQFEERSGQLVVRYATADRMRPSCVECHNTHPDSPKRDWVEGDVRGVLEIARPVASSTADTRLDLRTTIRRLVGIAVLALIGLGLVVVVLRRTALHSQQMAAETVESNLLLAQEIEQRQHAEDQAIFAQKLESLGLLAGGIAHDFNNLLVGILGNSEMALLHVSDDADTRRHLELIQQGGERAKDLIKQMLTYAGQQAFEKQPVHLTERIEAVAPLMLTASGRAARLVFEMDPDLPILIGDPAQLDQVIMNLVTNAADAMGDDSGIITIRTGMVDEDEDIAGNLFPSSTPVAESTRIFLEVEDTGCGLNDEARKRMFDPFFSTKGAGRGLGLAALQGIVRAHDGTILVASDEGVGTLFRIEFPVDLTLKDTPIAPAPRADLRGEGVRILVVDDDSDARATTQTMLETRGFEVEAVASGLEAIDRIEGDGPPIDSIVLDMSMPVMSGLDTYQRLSVVRPDLHVVFISGFTVEEEIHDLVTRGQVEFLQKPFSIGDLVKAVHSARIDGLQG